MDIKATPNSHRYKAEQAKASEKKVQKIVSGNVKTRKKSEMSKFKDTIFAEDVNSVKSYLFIDVIIPAIKKAIFETVTNGVDMMLYGEVRGKKRSSYDQVSYRDYSKSDRPYSSRSSTSFDLDEISFDNRGDAEAVLDGMTDILNESDGIENFKVEDLGQSLSDYAGKVASMDFTQIAGSLTVASRLATFIKGLSGLDTSGVSSFKKAVSTLGQTDTSNVAKAFSSASGDITSAGNSIVESLSKGISSKSSEATSAASGVIDKMNSEIMHKASVFLAAGTALILKLAAGIRENSSYAESAANSAVSNAANSIRGFYSSFHESGSYVGIGLINGLNSQYQAVYNAGYRLGQAAILGERAGQQSHSPSKLAEQSGVWVGEGLVIGVDSMGRKVYEAGESLGENVTSSLSSVISKASDLFEMSMDAEPVISPVVDLTNVKAASSSMSSMFSDLSIGTNANLRAVDVMMSNRGQNGNSDVVAAINRLGKKLSNMGNTYNSIDGVTYDESSSVSNAIQTLTRAVVVEGRR